MPVQIQMAQPADLAGAWLKGVQTAAQIRESKERLDAQAAETSARLQAQAAQAAQERAVQQQRIAVTQAYHQEQTALRKQQLEQAEAVNAQKTQAAARQFQARQMWQQGLDRIDSDTNLTADQKDAQKTSLIMRLAPSMGTPGTEAAQMLRDMRPPKPTVPASVEDKGDFLQVTEPSGAVNIHFKPKEAKATADKDPLVTVRLDDSTLRQMHKSQAQQVIAGLPKELQDNPVNKAVMSDAAQPQKREAVGKYKIGSVYKGGLKYLGGDPADEESWQKVQ